MTSQVQPLYEAVLGKIKDVFYALSSVISDFEKALQNSFQQVFPGIKHVDCHLHYAQVSYFKLLIYVIYDDSDHLEKNAAAGVDRGVQDKHDPKVATSREACR